MAITAKYSVLYIIIIPAYTIFLFLSVHQIGASVPFPV